MVQALLQNGAAFMYEKVGQILLQCCAPFLFYKVGQVVLLSREGITKWCIFNYNVGQVLQSGKIITK